MRMPGWPIGPCGLFKRRAIVVFVTLFSIAAAPFVQVTAVAQLPVAETPHVNSADRLLFWTRAEDVAALSDAQLDLWKDRGVGGFICMTRQLKGMGGTDDFTGEPLADLSAAGYAAQRSLRDSQIVRRAKERGLKLYLGCYVVDYYNIATPFKEWFDDAGWTNVVLPRVRDFAAAAKQLGFAGVAFDQELYPQKGNQTTATWHWNYPGNKHSEKQVREQARQRGRQLMQAILEGFSQVELVVYHFQFPGTWEPVVQKVVNKVDGSAAGLLFTEFYDGMTSVEGYDAIRFLNALFYKGCHVGTWNAAFQHEYNGFYSTLSRRFANWPYACSRVFLSPFSWIDGDVVKAGRYSAPRPPAYVAEQLAAHRKWGMGGEIANYCYRPLSDFDYTPYLAAIDAAGTPGEVDTERPHLEVTSPSRDAMPTTASTIDVEGFAKDNLAIRFIRWKSDRGGEGAARMTWEVESGDYRTGYEWRMNWSIQGIALEPGANQIVLTAEDIKGLTASQTLMVNRK